MRYIVDAETMRQIEQKTIEQYKIDALLLMEHAAMALCGRVKAKIQHTGGDVLCVCGRGNNGGDGIAAARLLACEGYSVALLCVGPCQTASDLFQKQMAMADQLGIPKISIAKAGQKRYAVIVDAIFGIGFHGSLDTVYQEAAAYINQAGAYVISADIPSGIHADTGIVKGAAVKADETVAFGLCKTGLLLYPGAEYAGDVHTAPIGLPEALLEELCGAGAFRCLERTDIRPNLPARRADSHKGSYGRVLVIAGSDEMPGACYLAASAAYHTGAGLVKVLTTKAAAGVVYNKLPEALASVYQEGDVLSKAADALAWADAVLIGPGLGTGGTASMLLDFVLRHCKKKLVLDADALNLTAAALDAQGIQNWKERLQRIAEILPENTVLTPHLKEFSRLLKLDTAEVRERLTAILRQCTYDGLVYVIKDARTITASASVKYINTTGNHGMATGGSGDVLSGIIAGLLAGGLTKEMAGGLGVYLHGLCGDLAAAEKGAYAMLAGDLIAHYQDAAGGGRELSAEMSV